MSRLKGKLLILVSLSLVLAACAQPSQTTPTEEIEPIFTATSASIVSCPAPEKAPSCIATGAQPTPNATLQALLPPPAADEWIEGPEDAYITLIEYGDFQ